MSSTYVCLFFLLVLASPYHFWLAIVIEQQGYCSCMYPTIFTYFTCLTSAPLHQVWEQICQCLFFDPFLSCISYRIWLCRERKSATPRYSIRLLFMLLIFIHPICQASAGAPLRATYAAKAATPPPERQVSPPALVVRASSIILLGSGCKGCYWHCMFLQILFSTVFLIPFLVGSCSCGCFEATSFG